MDIVPISQQTLIFRNSTSKVVTASITEDDLLEMDETFFAELSVSPGEQGVELNPSVAEIVILNDDSKFWQCISLRCACVCVIDHTFAHVNGSGGNWIRPHHVHGSRRRRVLGDHFRHPKCYSDELHDGS